MTIFTRISSNINVWKQHLPHSFIETHKWLSLALYVTYKISHVLKPVSFKFDTNKKVRCLMRIWKSKSLALKVYKRRKSYMFICDECMGIFWVYGAWVKTRWRRQTNRLKSIIKEWKRSESERVVNRSLNVRLNLKRFSSLNARLSWGAFSLLNFFFNSFPFFHYIFLTKTTSHILCFWY